MSFKCGQVSPCPDTPVLTLTMDLQCNLSMAATVFMHNYCAHTQASSSGMHHYNGEPSIGYGTLVLLHNITQI